MSCKKTSKLGKWLRCPQEADNSIEELLKHKNAKAKHEDRPAYMTVDLYLTQHIQEEHSLKRNAKHDKSTTTTKRKKTILVNEKNLSFHCSRLGSSVVSIL